MDVVVFFTSRGPEQHCPWNISLMLVVSIWLFILKWKQCKNIHITFWGPKYVMKICLKIKYTARAYELFSCSVLHSFVYFYLIF